jgi:hypothetical protein
VTEDTPKLTAQPIVLAGLETCSIGPSRVIHAPTAWRLARRNGELILQAGSIWTQGRDAGYEWSDVPTVDLDGEAGP